MAFPVTIDPAAPAGADSPALGDDQIRALKQAILDLFGIPGSPTSISAALNIVDSTGRWAVPIRLTNKTGGAVVAGDVAAIDSGNDVAAALGDTANSLKRFVVALESIANNSTGLWAIAGYVTVNTQGTIARGQYIQKSATSKKVEDAGAAIGDSIPPPNDAMGLALTAAAAGTATALWWGGMAGGGAGTSYVPLPIVQATLPDATGSGNNPPEVVREVSTGTQTTNSPKVTQTLAKFDAATDEHLMWSLTIPGNWTAGATLRGTGKAATATTGAAFLKGSIAVSVDSSTDDDAIVFNTVTGVSWSAPGTQGQTVAFNFALTATNMAANRKATIFFGRDADGTLGTDDMTGDFILTSLAFEYS